jgi:hypothetical protein
VSGSTTADLLRITQTGTGNVLVVEDSTNPDLTPFVIQADGKIAIGTYSTVANLEVRATGANGILLGPDLSGAIASARLFFSNGIAGQHSAILNTTGNIDFRTDGTNNSSTGTNRMVIERTTGNVGIAQFNPLARLHVESSSTGIGILATGSTTQDLVRITQTGTGNALVVEDSTNPDSTQFVVNASGAVGIGGSPNASYKLDVIGGTLSAAINASSVTGDGLVASGGGPGRYGVFASNVGDTSGTYIAVYGQAFYADTASVTSTYIGGYFVADGAGSAKNYAVLLQDGTQGLNKLLVDVTGSGGANWTSSINVTSIIASASSTSDIVRITQTGTGNALVVEDSANPDISPFVVDSSGNIGIGTASPSTKLHVVSTTSGAIRIVDGTQQLGYVLTSDGNGVGTWQVATAPLSGTINYVPFYKTPTTLSSTSSIQVSGDTVGIGISFSNTGGPSRDYRLHVHYGSGTYGVMIEGGGGIPENIPLRLWDSGSGANNINVLEFGHATASPKQYVPGSRIRSINPASGAVTGANMVLETSSQSDPISTTWNTSQLYLRNDGHIGIGTDVPYSYLTVNTPGGTLWSGGSTAEHAIMMGSQSSGSEYLFMGVDENISTAYMQAGIRGSSAIPILFNPSGGNVGIGLTAPSAKLHVATTLASIALIIASGSTTADMVRITQTGTGNALVVEDSDNPDSTPFVVKGTGNVGIGTTNPNTTLHVSGTQRLTGTFSGNTENNVASDAMVQAILLYLSNNC